MTKETLQHLDSQLKEAGALVFGVRKALFNAVDLDLLTAIEKGEYSAVGLGDS